MPVMRYIPQFIEKQYVPLNDLGLIDKALAQRQKLHDTSKMLENQTLSELYGLSTTQGFEPERNRIIEDLQTKIQEATARRGGDPSAATQDIMSIIATAQKNPFFQRNREVMEQAQLLEKMRASNPSLRILRDPRTLEYNPNLTAEDLQYQVLDPTQITKITEDMFGDLRKKRGELQAVRHPVFGTVARQQLGATDEEITGLSTPETVNQVLSQAGYSDLAETNPELYNEMAGIVYNQLKSLNQGYDDTPWSPPYSNRATSTGNESQYYGSGIMKQSGISMLPKTIDEARAIIPERLDAVAVAVAKKHGLKGVTTFRDLESMSYPTVNPDYTPPVGDLRGFQIPRKNANAKIATEALSEVKGLLGDEKSFGYNSYNLNALRSASPKDITTTNTVIDQLTNTFVSPTTAKMFAFPTNKDETRYNSIKDKSKIEIVNIIPTYGSNASLAIEGVGYNDKQEPVFFIKHLKRDPKIPFGRDPNEQMFFEYLAQISPEIDLDYNIKADPAGTKAALMLRLSPKEMELFLQKYPELNKY